MDKNTDRKPTRFLLTILLLVSAVIACAAPVLVAPDQAPQPMAESNDTGQGDATAPAEPEIGL